MRPPTECLSPHTPTHRNFRATFGLSRPYRNFRKNFRESLTPPKAHAQEAAAHSLSGFAFPYSSTPAGRRTSFGSSAGVPTYRAGATGTRPSPASSEKNVPRNGRARDSGGLHSGGGLRSSPRLAAGSGGKRMGSLTHADLDTFAFSPAVGPVGARGVGKR